MNAKPFPHNYETIFGVTDISGINGYSKCLRQLYAHLAEVTEFNPAKRYIDAAELLERISATCIELSSIMATEQAKLQEEFTDLQTLKLETK